MRPRLPLLVALLLLGAGCVSPDESAREASDEPAPATPPPRVQDAAVETSINETADANATATDGEEPPPTPATPAATPSLPAPTAPVDATTAPANASANSSAWPQEGSYVRYRTSGGSDSDEGSDHLLAEESIIDLTYKGGRWSGTCDWTRGEITLETSHFGRREMVRMDNASGGSRVVFAPLTVDRRDPDIADMLAIHQCQRVELGTGGFDVDEWPDEWTTMHETPGWLLDDGFDWGEVNEPSSPTTDSFAHWDGATGLVVAWRHEQRDGFTDGWIEATDAPLGGDLRSLP